MSTSDKSTDRRPGIWEFLGGLLILGLAGSIDVQLSLLEVLQLPLLGSSGLWILFAMLLIVGVPLMIGFGVAGALIGWLRRGSAGYGLQLLCVLLFLLAFGALAVGALAMGGDGMELLRRHIVLLLALAVVGFTWFGGGFARKVVAGVLVVVVVFGAAWAFSVPWLNQANTAGTEPSPLFGGHQGKVLLIGVDGLSWDVVQRFRAAGSSNELEWLMANSVHAPLDTIEPTSSPIIWTSMATGREPRAHGVQSFTSWRIKNVSKPLGRLPRMAGAFYWKRVAEKLGWVRLGPVTSVDVQTPTFWEIASTDDRPAHIVGWWCTWPAPPLRGELVSDKFYFWRDALRAGQGRDARAPTRGLTYPAELESQLEPLRVSPDSLELDRMREYVALNDEEAARWSEREYEYQDVMSELPLALSMDDTVENVALDMFARSSPNATHVVYLRGVDLVGHAALTFSDLYPDHAVPDERRQRYGALTETYYRRTFERIRRLIEAAGDDAVVLIVSDHGFENLGRPKRGETWNEFGHSKAPQGSVFALGRGVDLRAEFDQPHVMDLAPTMLGLLGFAAAEDMPGRVWTEILPVLRISTLENRVPSYGSRAGLARFDLSGGAQTDEDELELLRSLGYIQ